MTPGSAAALNLKRNSNPNSSASRAAVDLAEDDA
jgi:hypothetical protein